MTIKEIVGFPGYYIDDSGVVWSSKLKGGSDRSRGKTGPLRPIRAHRNRSGYMLVGFDVDGRNVSRFIHRLVLEAFVGPRPEGTEACHYPDPDKSNNRLENLRWDSHDENIRDKHRDRGTVTNKLCCGCGIEKCAFEFYPDKRASDGLGSRCKLCHIDLAIKTRDPEKKRAANREYMRRRRLVA